MMLIVLVDDCEVEVAHVTCHALKPYHLDVLNTENEGLRLSYIDQTAFGRLQKHVRTEGSTEEA